MGTRSSIRRPNPVLAGLAIASLIVGVLLMALNFYGLTQSFRKPGLGVTEPEMLRFGPQEVWSYDQSQAAIASLDGSLPHSELARQASRVVNQSLVHISWFEVDPVEYRQRVPIWENYFLWAMGTFSGLPQFERYHYADYERSIARGIGICGDASAALSTLLDQHGIPNRIFTFNGHIVVEFEREDGTPELIDPDFGVDLGMSLDEVRAAPDEAKEKYLAAGYSERESETVKKAFLTQHYAYDGTFDFMNKRYMFETMSYWLKWPLPILLIALPILYLGGTWKARGKKEGKLDAS